MKTGEQPGIGPRLARLLGETPKDVAKPDRSQLRPAGGWEVAEPPRDRATPYPQKPSVAEPLSKPFPVDNPLAAKSRSVLPGEPDTPVAAHDTEKPVPGERTPGSAEEALPVTTVQDTDDSPGSPTAVPDSGAYRLEITAQVPAVDKPVTADPVSPATADEVAPAGELEQRVEKNRPQTGDSEARAEPRVAVQKEPQRPAATGAFPAEPMATAVLEPAPRLPEQVPMPPTTEDAASESTAAPQAVTPVEAKAPANGHEATPGTAMPEPPEPAPDPPTRPTVSVTPRIHSPERHEPQGETSAAPAAAPPPAVRIEIGEVLISVKSPQAQPRRPALSMVRRAPRAHTIPLSGLEDD